MSNKVCCVPGCSNSSGSVPLHKFPNPAVNKNRFNTWLYSVGGEILGLSNDHIFKYRRICRKHFEEKYWCRNNLLSNVAVPTKNMPGLSLPRLTHTERRPLQNVSEASSSKGPEAVESLVQSSAIDVQMKENVGLSLPRLTHTERRPLRSIQNVSEASSSKGPEAAESLVQSSAIDVQMKENIGPEAAETLVQSAAIDAQMKENVGPEAAETLVQGADKDAQKEENVGPEAPETLVQGAAIDAQMKENVGSHKTGITKVVRKRKLCTPVSQVEQYLHKKLKQIGVKLSKCRSKVKKQAGKIKAMQNIVSHPQFSKALDNWPSTAKLLTLLQFREHKKGLKGRRFTLQEKIMALSIFKQSPKGYRFFRRIFILPSPQTLIKLINMADIKPGINESTVQQIKKAAEKMTMEDKLCIVLFDEMSLKCNLSYNQRKDCVTGFVTNGKETRPEFADHAQVFLLRGLLKNYKQPIAYTFSQAATKGPELAVQLKEIIQKLQEAGLIVVATVCDQGTNNVQCIKLLIQETKARILRQGEEQKGNYFMVNNAEIVPLYDPPHLIKGIRNNLINKHLKYVKDNIEKTAKWEHITGLHNENPGYGGIRLVPKLTDYHCNPSKIPRMKVKYATQVFSQTVATNMGYLADKGILSSDFKETADILLFFDRLFDSVNGSFGKRKKFGKPLLGPASPTSIHHQIWNDSKRMLKNMKFVNSHTLKVEHVPTIKNWVWTIEGIQLLIKKLNSKYGVNSIWMRHLNQDPIENFFGSIRSHGCRNVNPSPDKFESAYTTLLVNSLSSVHAPGANCEKDNCFALSSVIIAGGDCKAKHVLEIENIPEISITPLEEKNDPRQIGGLQYVSGYFLKSAKKNVFKGCDQCKKDLHSEEQWEYIKYREYSDKKWLCSPSVSLLCCISNVQDIISKVMKESLQKTHIGEFIKTIILMFIEFDFIKCENHKEELIIYLIMITCKFFLHHYCKEINNILNGKRACDDDVDFFKMKAKKYNAKCFKRKQY